MHYAMACTFIQTDTLPQGLGRDVGCVCVCGTKDICWERGMREPEIAEKPKVKSGDDLQHDYLDRSKLERTPF